MTRVEWINLSENVQTLKKNISSLEEITVVIKTVCKCSEQVRANAEWKLPKKKKLYGVTVVSRKLMFQSMGRGGGEQGEGGGGVFKLLVVVLRKAFIKPTFSR